MSDFPTSSEVDILFIMEGSYPLVRGGVSKWVHDLISGLPQFRFGVIFLGSEASQYSGLCYALPDNLVHLEVHYLFSESSRKNSQEACPHAGKFSNMCLLHRQFSQAKPEERNTLLSELHQILSSDPKIMHEHFLHSMDAWDFIKEQYSEKCPDIIFLEYFWSVRNMHSALWKTIDLASQLPRAKILHSASTGYAGFLASLAHFHSQTPFVLTEHGIYTKERKFDLQTADWQASQQPMQFLLQKKTREYLRDLWIRFFTVLAGFCYSSADRVLSLFQLYSIYQVQEGAPQERVQVIPNGIVLNSAFEGKQLPDPKNPLVIFVGRVVSIKDLKTFIRAVLLLHDANPGLKAWIVGPTSEDEMYAQECRDLVSVLGLESVIEFLGEQTVSNIYPKADLLFLTSMSEGMPLCVLEAFSYGVPVIATDAGSCAELIYGHTTEDRALGAAGAVVAIGDAQSLAREADTLLKDAQLWKQASQSAHQRVKHYYQQKDIVRRYANLYEEVMQDGRDRI